jgi:hypothetical protein
MKTTFIIYVFLLSALSLRPAQADSTFIGTLAGAGAGLVAANNVDGVSPWIAAPVGAIAGGYLASRYDDNKQSSHQPKRGKKSRLVPTVNLQPGIDLIKVSILNSNGMQTDISILRIKDKFIGPQGEEYSALPTAEALAQIYGM